MSWLRPRWYIAPFGGGMTLGSVRPHVFVDPREPDPICTNCGAACSNGGFDFDSGYECIDCGDATYANRKRPLARRIGWRIEAVLRLDDLYWWYCERFGKRVYQSPQV